MRKLCHALLSYLRNRYFWQAHVVYARRAANVPRCPRAGATTGPRGDLLALGLPDQLAHAARRKRHLVAAYAVGR